MGDIGHDLTGQTFGLLTVEGQEGSDKYGNKLWRCLCSCRKYIILRSSKLVLGERTSCGCANIGRGGPPVVLEVKADKLREGFRERPSDILEML